MDWRPFSSQCASALLRDWGIYSSQIICLLSNSFISLLAWRWQTLGKGSLTSFSFHRITACCHTPVHWTSGLFCFPFLSSAGLEGIHVLLMFYSTFFTWNLKLNICITECEGLEIPSLSWLLPSLFILTCFSASQISCHYSAVPVP